MQELDSGTHSGSEKKLCRLCAFFDEEGVTYGRCKRYPPAPPTSSRVLRSLLEVRRSLAVLNRDSFQEFDDDPSVPDTWDGLWDDAGNSPIVRNDDWCGEFQRVPLVADK